MLVALWEMHLFHGVGQMGGTPIIGMHPLSGKRRDGEHFLAGLFLEPPSLETTAGRRTERECTLGYFLITLWGGNRQRNV